MLNGTLFEVITLEKFSDLLQISSSCSEETVNAVGVVHRLIFETSEALVLPSPSDNLFYLISL